MIEKDEMERRERLNQCFLACLRQDALFNFQKNDH